MKTTDPQQEMEQALQKKEAELALAKHCLTQFTRGVSHELESPIKTLNNLLRLFEEDYRHRLDTDGAESLTMIQTSARRSRTMIEGIIRFTRCSRLTGTPEETNVGDAIADALKELKPVIERDDATIVIGEIPAVRTYRTALRQVLYELLDNSLGFTTPDNKQPSISISGHRQLQGVEIVITDEGPGISQRDGENIFDIFTRLNAQKDHEGSGLGLPICLQLVSAMQGRLWVDTSRATGAAFHVYIPDSNG